MHRPNAQSPLTEMKWCVTYSLNIITPPTPPPPKLNVIGDKSPRDNTQTLFDRSNRTVNKETRRNYIETNSL